MERVLVAYASKHGSTAEIAEAIAAELRVSGLDADCRAADAVKSVDEYDAVVLGSAVYMKRWQRSARKLLSREHETLTHQPLWIFSSGPTGDKPPDPDWIEPKNVVKEAERLGARGHVVFGGRVSLDSSSRIARSMAVGTPEEYRDRRDWDEIRAWARDIATALSTEHEVTA